MLWLQAIVHKVDRQYGESIPLDSLTHCNCLVFRLDELIGKVNDGVLLVFDEESSTRQEVHLLTGLEVSKSRVLSALCGGVKVLELPLTLVEMPELLLGSAAHKQFLLVEILLLNDFIVIIDGLPVGY